MVIDLLPFFQYLVPFVLNQSGSLVYYLTLSSAGTSFTHFVLNLQVKYLIYMSVTSRWKSNEFAMILLLLFYIIMQQN